MKARSKELLERSVAAMVAAIGVYNQPSFPYRAESFAILAINGWELLLKARWLADNNNKERSLYVRERRQKTDGQKTRKLFIKRTRSGNPFTHSLDFLGKKLVEEKQLDACAWANLMALMEMRVQADPRFGIVRYLDPAKPNGPKKIFFNPNILQELDRVFQKKRIAEA